MPTGFLVAVTDAMQGKGACILMRGGECDPPCGSTAQRGQAHLIQLATLCLQSRSREVTAGAQLAFFLSLNEVWAPVHKAVPLTLREGPSSPVVFPWQHPHLYLEVCLSGEFKSWQVDSEDESAHIFF